MVAGCTVKQRTVFVDREGRRNRRRELNQLHVLLCVVARQHVAAADSMAPTRLDARGACFVCLPERAPSGAAIFGGRRALRSSARAAFGMASSAPRSTAQPLPPARLERHRVAASHSWSPCASPRRACQSTRRLALRHRSAAATCCRATTHSSTCSWCSPDRRSRRPRSSTAHAAETPGSDAIAAARSRRTVDAAQIRSAPAGTRVPAAREPPNGIL